LNNAVRSDPRWRKPVGEGANRVLAGAFVFEAWWEVVEVAKRRFRKMDSREIYRARGNRRAIEVDI